MRSRLRQFAAQLRPAAAHMLFGGYRECEICRCRISHAAAVHAAPPDTPPGLDRVLRSLRRLLCGRCLAAVPWIRSAECAVCGRAAACPDCAQRRNPDLVMNRAAVQYDSRMKEWLAAYKYQGQERLQRIFSLMAEHAYLQLAQQAGTAGSPFQPVITCVPISGIRLQERGFNQAERIAAELAHTHNLKFAPLLRRVRHTDRQSHKSRAERLRDLEGAFAADRSAIDVFRDSAYAATNAILIVDDVYTTGSTLHECAKALREAFNLPVYSITWAR